MTLDTLTQQQVRAFFAYDTDTGVLTWRVARGSTTVGKNAGCNSPDGYLRVRVLGTLYLTHRLIWLWMTGEWPDTVDHIDGQRANNRWVNLRQGTMQFNNQNIKRAQRDNSTGLLGVYPRGRRFAAEVKFNLQKHWCGTFDTPEEAHQAYLAKKRELHEGNTL